MTMTPTREQSPQLASPMRRPLRPGSPPPGITPQDIWRIILKRKWLIILSFVICSAVMGTVTLLLWRFAKGYTAEAYLAVAPPPVSMMHIRVERFGKDIVERHKRSQAALVKHQAVLNEAAKDRRVAGDANTEAKKWFRKHMANIHQELDDEIDVSLMPETDIIRLSMTGTNRTELADIVNAMADAFVKYTKENTRRRRTSKILKLDNSKKTLERRLINVRRQLATAKMDKSIAAMQGRQSLIGVKLQVLTQQIHQAEMDLSEAESGAKAYEEGMKDGSIVNDPQILQAMEFDYTLRSFKVRLAEMETSLHNAASKFGQKHRQVRDIKLRIQAIKDQIASREKEVFTTNVAAMGQMRGAQLGAAQKQLADLLERLHKTQGEAKDLQRSLGNIEAYTQEIKETQARIADIDTRLNDLEMLGSRPGEEWSETGPVSVHAYATEPRKEQWTRPKVSVLLSLGAVLGLIIGFGLAFLLEFIDTSIKSPSDLARRIDLPLLGMVPHGDDLDEEIADFRRVAVTAPHSPAAEAFRQIRTNLLFSGPEQQRRSLLVTSPAPQDGRTSVTINLAASMAQAGRKVLVVDTNFRRPAVAEMFPQAEEAGLSSTVVGQAAWRDVVSTTDVPNLSVMAAGPLPPNPAELLGSDAMGTIIAEMTAEYDQVLFDGSPLMVVADACVLGTKVDGVILVVRAGVNSAGIVQRSAERLSRVGARVFGVVLQGVRITAGGYLRKNYETFYEYHQKSLT